MNMPLRNLRSVAEAFGALGGIAVAISAILVGVDCLNHLTPSLVNFVALLVSGSVATLAGLLNRAAAPWFGWLAYGTMIASATLGLPLILASALTGKLPNDPNYWGVFAVSLLLFVCAFPAVLFARRWARGSKNAI